MLSFIAFTSLFLSVFADPTPTVPAPGAVYNEGSNCVVQWNADTSGSSTWKNMKLQLMTGDNLNMIPLTSELSSHFSALSNYSFSAVGTVDGTDSSNTVFTYPCPNVCH